MPSAIRRDFPNANAGAANLGRVPITVIQRASLKGEFIFGRDIATSCVNSAYDDAPDAVVIGSPTLGDHTAALAGTNYIDTRVSDNLALTVMVISSPGASLENEVYFASEQNGVPQAVLLSYNGSPNVIVQGYSASGILLTPGIAMPGSLTAPLTDYRAVTFRTDQAVNPTFKIDEFKAGIRTQGASTAQTGTRAAAIKTLAIGSLKNATFTDVNNVCAVLIWHSHLSDADLLAAYLEARTYLADMGKAI